MLLFILSPPLLAKDGDKCYPKFENLQCKTYTVKCFQNVSGNVLYEGDIVSQHTGSPVTTKQDHLLKPNGKKVFLSGDYTCVTHEKWS